MRMTVLRTGLAPVLLLTAQLSFAHADHEPEFLPQLLPLPEAMAGIKVQLVHTLAPQLLISNQTTKTLAVLAQDNKPFIRFGSKGAEANVRHQTWFDTYLPGGLPTRKPEAGVGADWRVVSEKNTWGWFDLRLRPEKVTANSRWAIPVLVNGKPTQIEGKFVPALQKGAWQASWDKPPALPEGVRLQLVPGQPFGIMLASTLKTDVIVQDRDHHPFLRVGPKQTHAHTGSQLWRETTTQLGLLDAAQGAKPSWQLISGGGRYTWLEPRTQPTDMTSRKPYQWHINLVIDNKMYRVDGTSRWSAAKH
ncbi:MAG: hypothetical protein Q8L72_10715 [Moraxellaceae bacterium]|nr:hypothetical protein [Moraxellaceae bacterium]